MLRIYFTSDDVARTRIAPAPDPLWELIMALQMLRPQEGDLLFREWRSTVRATIRRAALGDPLQLLLALTPTVGYFPDFLNPSAAIHGLEHGLEAIRRTPKAALGNDMRHLARSRPLPDDAQRLASGEPTGLIELTDTMRACYRLAITPYQRTIDAAVDRDRRLRLNALAANGVEGLLTSLRSTMFWSSGELRIPTHRDQELHLNGRGLLFIPSYFCLTPTTMLDPALPPVVVYPVAKQDTVGQKGHHARTDQLRALIGTTRATLLQALAVHPTTTTEIARHVGISASTASEHTTVLRQAGLIASYRDRNRVLHHATTLGLALIDPDQAQFAQANNP